MRVLIDTNILLDLLCNRKGFVDNAEKIFKLCETKLLDGCVSALSIPNIVYIMRKELDGDHITRIIRMLSSIFEIVDLKGSDMARAAELPMSDFEDALQSVCATRMKASFIVTRNVKDFRNSKVVAITPDELLERVVD